MTMTVVRSAILLVFLATAASAEEIKVMTSGAFTAAYLEVIPIFERQTGHKVTTAFGASTGNAPDSIPARLQRGEATDIIILSAPALEALTKEGKVIAGSRVDLARSSIGVAVKAGAPRPDISTVEALKRTLLAAKSIAYSASVSGTYLSTEMFQTLGIADQVLPKSKRIESERVGTVVARGDAELGFQQVSELLPIPGIDFVGTLPAEVQRVTVFSAGLATGARATDAARALMAFLASAATTPAKEKSGLEPIAR